MQREDETSAGSSSEGTFSISLHSMTHIEPKSILLFLKVILKESDFA